MKKLSEHLTYKKINLIIYISAFCLFILVSINYYITSTAVISGTHHVFLPSQNYVLKNVSGLSYNSYMNGKIIRDTINSGDFLIAVNFMEVDTLSNFPEKIFKGRVNDFYTLTIFKKNRLPLLFPESDSRKFMEVLDTIIVSGDFFKNGYLKFLTKGIVVGYKEPGGATDRAGLWVGDIILSMNDEEIQPPRRQESKATTEIFRIIRSQKAGEKVRYQILRDGQYLTLDVYMAVVGMRLEAFIGLICGILLYTLALFYIIFRPKIFGARIVGLSLLIFGFTILTAYLANPPGLNLFSKIMTYLDNVSFMFLIPVLFHSLIYFPDYKFELLKRRWILMSNYVIGALVIITFTAWYFIDLEKMNDEVFLIAEIVQFLFGVISISWYYVRKKTNQEKNNFIVLYIAIMAVFLGLFCRPVLYYSGLSIPKFLNYDSGFTIILPFTYIVVTLRYKIFGIRTKIKRSIQYSIISYIWKSLLMIGFIFSLLELTQVHISFPVINISSTKIEILREPIAPETNIKLEKYFVTIAAFLSLFIIYKFGKIVQNFIDRKFYREKKNYKLLQTELVNILNKKFTIESLSRLLLEKLVDLIHLKCAGIIFIKDEKEVWDEKIYFSDGSKYTETSLEVTDDVISRLKEYDDIVGTEYLMDSSGNVFPFGKIEKAIVIKSNGKLLGLLLIGEKLSETAINNEDSEFLFSLISNIAVAIDNTFLYEQLSHQERMKHELEIARSLQLSTLPQSLPIIDGLDIYAKSLPAMEVGGDFYDFLNGNPDELTVVIGDVSGKGTSSALYMSKIQGILETLYQFNLTPRELMIKANKLLYKHILSNSFITVLGGKFNIKNNLLQVVRAGHLPLFYFDSDLCSVRQSCPRGMGLGLSGDDVFESSIEEVTFKIKKGDIFLFISDGVIEGLSSSGEQFGETRLNEILIKNNMKKSLEIGEEIIRGVVSFTENVLQFDDMTLVVVKIE
jgi:serine phosphatase RsbU (regulator of sigma subunit)